MLLQNHLQTIKYLIEELTKYYYDKPNPFYDLLMIYIKVES